MTEERENKQLGDRSSGEISVGSRAWSNVLDERENESPVIYSAELLKRINEWENEQIRRRNEYRSYNPELSHASSYRSYGSKGGDDPLNSLVGSEWSDFALYYSKLEKNEHTMPEYIGEGDLDIELGYPLDWRSPPHNSLFDLECGGSQTLCEEENECRIAEHIGERDVDIETGSHSSDEWVRQRVVWRNISTSYRVNREKLERIEASLVMNSVPSDYQLFDAGVINASLFHARRRVELDSRGEKEKMKKKFTKKPEFKISLEPFSR